MPGSARLPAQGGGTGRALEGGEGRHQVRRLHTAAAAATAAGRRIAAGTGAASGLAGGPGKPLRCALSLNARHAAEGHASRRPDDHHAFGDAALHECCDKSSAEAAGRYVTLVPHCDPGKATFAGGPEGVPAVGIQREAGRRRLQRPGARGARDGAAARHVAPGARAPPQDGAQGSTLSSMFLEACWMVLAGSALECRCSKVCSADVTSMCSLMGRPGLTAES